MSTGWLIRPVIQYDVGGGGSRGCEPWLYENEKMTYGEAIRHALATTSGIVITMEV